MKIRAGHRPFDGYGLTIDGCTVKPLISWLLGLVMLRSLTAGNGERVQWNDGM